MNLINSIVTSKTPLIQAAVFLTRTSEVMSLHFVLAMRVVQHNSACPILVRHCPAEHELLACMANSQRHWQTRIVVVWKWSNNELRKTLQWKIPINQICSNPIGPFPPSPFLRWTYKITETVIQLLQKKFQSTQSSFLIDFNTTSEESPWWKDLLKTSFISNSTTVSRQPSARWGLAIVAIILVMPLVLKIAIRAVGQCSYILNNRFK